ncbi:hypothetical protein BASA62_002208 [Batrachochytrium salamandrivorans]|nr:hypothetical protein BASA62_002208 [Batrachochytrium salamandrivorans]
MRLGNISDSSIRVEQVAQPNNGSGLYQPLQSLIHFATAPSTATPPPPLTNPSPPSIASLPNPQLPRGLLSMQRSYLLTTGMSTTLPLGASSASTNGTNSTNSTIVRGNYTTSSGMRHNALAFAQAQAQAMHQYSQHANIPTARQIQPQAQPQQQPQSSLLQQRHIQLQPYSTPIPNENRPDFFHIQGSINVSPSRSRSSATSSVVGFADTHSSRAIAAAAAMPTAIDNVRSGPGTVNPSVHPQFRSKAVCKLFCHHCESLICLRGMRAILLGNAEVELFSTDTPPNGVELVFEDYLTQNCVCRIRDAACVGCGNVVGYHVTQPCEKCLDACNNGHFWMFLSGDVTYTERFDNTGTKVLRWAALPRCGINEDTSSIAVYDDHCR